MEARPRRSRTEPIVEIEAFQVAGHEDLINLSRLFPGQRCLRLDTRFGARRVAENRVNKRSNSAADRYVFDSALAA